MEPHELRESHLNEPMEIFNEHVPRVDVSLTVYGVICLFVFSAALRHVKLP